MCASAASAGAGSLKISRHKRAKPALQSRPSDDRRRGGPCSLSIKVIEEFIALSKTPPSDFVTVGNNPYSFAGLISAHGRRWYVLPLRIIPAFGQVPENLPKPSASLLSRASKQVCDVLHEDVSRSKLASKSDDFGPQAASVAELQSCERPGNTKVLAGEPPADDINRANVFSFHFSHIFENRHVRPVLP